ncbi:LemA family protein [Pseudogracilibacillus auburnensis]|uniref:LemA family protein n=1 Tax=Pseudogracilibacillus auburnensis TaxID=1494959 RepID=UPI001A971151|nr:LemA family protein [Pseudogracilibacillus auburnensis]MBO1003193.1 LemA family protein [Pseudogracilibacillus auburnensis]
MFIFISIFMIIFIILIMYIIITYNQFISLGERVVNGKAQIAAQLESRWDAVTNLIAATKKYTNYEAETLDHIVSQRVQISQSSSIEAIEQDDMNLNHVMGRLLAVAENYPELKASTVYETTMESINKYEDNVRHSRMIYNDVVTKFNRLVKMFPSNLVASLFHYTEKEYFEATETKYGMPNWE